ncbi:PREDICTED: uncharacterized protein LOC104801090 [Tarenaya hassleriana]|uniref:uncharacterized protein LOC104801090 n=1 Tax=Tarenaya hassleriana TaxID=28532 RepID=UPI00053C5E7A|nr:PREDICTED: uncharacterized protein LOC104801090 [Tarenaya hassleriana]
MECERSSSAETRISTRSGDSHRRSSTVAAGSRRRMYECTFCKRGFTNAQALGGHMNIHRRDRAKAKQNANANATTEEEEEEESLLCMNPNTPTTFGIIKSTAKDDHRVHKSFASSGPKLVMGGYEQDVLRTSLSLGIGSISDKDERVKESVVVVEGDEIDLELRLGS